MKGSLIITFLLITQITFGQTIISGLVKDKSNNEPVPFATVYINGTTIGTNTDNDGIFELKIPDFPTQVIISHISYEKLIFDFERAPDEKLQISLEPVKVEIEAIQVTDKNNRAKNIKEFKEVFLGLDEFGQEAILENEEVLVFEREYATKEITGIRLSDAKGQNKTTIKKTRTVKASSKAPLIVDLPKLGYKVQLDLAYFQNNYPQKLGQPNTINWLVYSYFQPYESDKKRQIKRWEKNRAMAFYHSQQHFFRSLHQGKLAENGYKIMIKKRDTIKNVNTFEPFDIKPHLSYLDDGLLEIRGLKGKEYTIMYYGKTNGRPLDLTFKKGLAPVASYVIFNQDRCFVRADGTVPFYGILLGGPISEKKIGATLPDNYLMDN